MAHQWYVGSNIQRRYTAALVNSIRLFVLFFSYFWTALRVRVKILGLRVRCVPTYVRTDVQRSGKRTLNGVIATPTNAPPPMHHAWQNMPSRVSDCMRQQTLYRV